MPNKTKNVDRISVLPDCLLHHIMSFLNTKEVVQTCVLSKSWKTVWTCIPTLNFDFNSYPFEGSTSNSNLTLKISSFNRFILRVLSNHCGSRIIKFSYSPPFYKNEKYFVDFLLCYVACHMVQELCIDSDIMEFASDWVQCLSACQSLYVLKIRCSFFAEWGALMLSSLRILEITNPDFQLITVKEMFSGCPNLESLVLVEFDFDGCVSICAPKLENLELSSSDEDWFCSTREIELFTPRLRCFKFHNLLPIIKSSLDFPCIDKVNITGNFDDVFMTRHGQKVPEVVNRLRLFHNARSITMSTIFVQAIVSVPAANLSFHNLRHLKLEASKTSKKIDLPMNKLRNLLNCPTLETMVLDLS